MACYLHPAPSMPAHAPTHGTLLAYPDHIVILRYTPVGFTLLGWGKRTHWIPDSILDES